MAYIIILINGSRCVHTRRCKDIGLFIF